MTWLEQILESSVGPCIILVDLTRVVVPRELLIDIQSFLGCRVPKATKISKRCLVWVQLKKLHAIQKHGVCTNGQKINHTLTCWKTPFKHTFLCQLNYCDFWLELQNSAITFLVLLSANHLSVLNMWVPDCTTFFQAGLQLMQESAL